MKVMIAILTVMSVLWSTSASASPYDGYPYYGTYSTYDYGANRYFDVKDRFRE